MTTQPIYERLEQQAQWYDNVAENLFWTGHYRLAGLYRALARAGHRLSWVN